MANKSLKLRTILKETNGELLFTEQVLEIGMKILDLSLEESNDMRRTYSKSFLTSKYDKLISEKLNEQSAQDLIRLLHGYTRQTVSRTYFKMKEAIDLSVIDSTLEFTEGKVKFLSQFYLLLTNLTNLETDSVHFVIKSYKNGQSRNIQTANHSIRESVRNQNIADKLIQILERDAASALTDNISILPFLEESNNEFKITKEEIDKNFSNIETYFDDYPSEPIGGSNPYYCCSYCQVPEPEINGSLNKHSKHCEYRIQKEKELDILPDFE